MSIDVSAPVTLQEQAPKLLTNIAGYVGHRTIALGLRQGLIAALAADDAPTTPADLARRLGLDPFYVAVWCRSALACGVCDLDGDEQHAAGDDAAVSLDFRLVLAPHVATLLLDTGHPAFIGGVFTVLEQPELFDRFEEVLGTGERLWWDGCSAEWITGVASTGMPFYRRLAPTGLSRVPGVAERLEQGCRIVDTACGSGVGLVHLARTYPRCTVLGVDGDGVSVERAREAVAVAGLADRVHAVQSPLEELELDTPVAVVINNISMHECRDIDEATRRIWSVLEPGGCFVISDFPFPGTSAGLRSVPGRIMCGIQFFEAQIDDQLLPRVTYDDLLHRHGFVDVGHVDISALHALTHGRVPAAS